MTCPVCGGDKIQYPAERTSMEICKCLSCGHAFAVHCVYPIPEQFRSTHKVFRGAYVVPSEDEKAKSYIKLKNILKGCERFQLSKLEKQRIEGKKIWELGEFLDFEVERIKVDCGRNALSIQFEEIN
ncbi:hypothetical protein KSF73_13205 [Burkholderiaceae bacterium DAT-1]|nr:hypothetical protein [Burkholderiaceae bacterium DAT-1]